MDPPLKKGATSTHSARSDGERSRSALFFLQLFVYLAENLTVFGCFDARVYALLFFISTKTDRHNVLVTHYGIRRLQSNTLWAAFPSHPILLGGGCWGGAGVQLARVASLRHRQTQQAER